MFSITRTIAAASILLAGTLGPLALVSANADAATKKPTVRCHAIVNGKKSWSTKFCPKPARDGRKGKSGINGVNGKDGLQGANGRDGAKGMDGTNGHMGANGSQGATGPQGPQGLSGLEGAFYAQAFYDVGNTNAGAIATVPCDSNPANTKFTAISGGVQVLGLGEGANSRNTPVSSSFAGRMDWNTNTPKPGRLDGWIVQFGGNAGATSDKDPQKVIVWALCVPRTDIPVVKTFTQSS